jgi:hypothetical protein
MNLKPLPTSDEEAFGYFKLYKRGLLSGYKN